ncbi:MAG: thiamine phosphate synthase, partial [Clostridia bacterium]|nr:thiamine phosphate synthase [Clostridia bacterium]
AMYKPKAIYLREKHLNDSDYLQLARQIKPVCETVGVDFYVCHNLKIAKLLGVKNVHINVENLPKIGANEHFDNLSVAVHSIKDVIIAQSYGATRLVYGHIFETSCKKDLQPRGLSNLKAICNISNLPVIAIGGINHNNFKSVLDSGASDFAIMSSAMTLTF